LEKCPDEYAGRWFSVFHRLPLSFLSEGLKDYNISSGQVMFLLELYYLDGINQEELSSYLNIDEANTTRAIKKLEKEGYVIRKRDEEDRRVKRIYLTEKALEIKPKVLDLMNQWEEKMLKSLTSVEREVFIDLLKKVGHSLSDNGRCLICGKNCSSNDEEW
jgi:DNA-binding MarR family transcriptional regulator